MKCSVSWRERWQETLKVRCFPQGLLKGDQTLLNSIMIPSYVSRRLGRYRVKELLRVIAWLGVLGWVSAWPSKANWELFWKSWVETQNTFPKVGGHLTPTWMDLWVCPHPVGANEKNFRERVAVRWPALSLYGEAGWNGCLVHAVSPWTVVDLSHFVVPHLWMGWIMSPPPKKNSYVKVLTPSI